MLKIIACLLMVIDHIGYLFFPNIIALRVIGRIAMPTFAFMIAKGYFYTRQKGATLKYLERLLLFAVISQAAYHFTFPTAQYLNIMFEWALALSFLMIADPAGIKAIRKMPQGARLICCYIITLTSYAIKAEYNVPGIVWVVAYYLWLKKAINVKQLLLMGSTASLLLIIQHWDSAIALVSIAGLASVPIVIMTQEMEEHGIYGPQMNKMFFYIFYPAHMVILKLAQALITP